MNEAVETWRRMTNPQTVEDYGLSVAFRDLEKSPEGRDILEREVMPFVPYNPQNNDREREPCEPR